jgi:hypothetical protein
VGSIASIALFIYLVQRTGPGAVLGSVRLAGWGVVVLILLSGVRHVLRAMAWSYCIQTDGRGPSALELLGPRLMGEALTDLTPVGPLLGEPGKVLAVSRLIPAQAGASSVVIENLLYALAALIFMLSGLVLAFVKLAALRGAWWIGGGTVFCLAAPIAVVYWTITRRISPVGRSLDFLNRWGRRWAFLERHQQSLRAVEKAVFDFFSSSRRAFLAILAIEIATNFTGIGEAYLILGVTTAHTSLLTAYLVECSSRAVQLAFSFVPLGLGVQEGAAAATLRSLGYAASEGVSLAIIRKIRTIFWAAVGLFFVAKYAMVLPEEKKSVLPPVEGSAIQI